MEQQGNNKILVIDDEVMVQGFYRTALEVDDSLLLKIDLLMEARAETPDRFEVHYASQGEQGVEMAREALNQKAPFAVAFVDVRMPPGINGLETAQLLYALDPRIHIVIVSAYSDYKLSTFREMVKGHINFMRKPLVAEEVEHMACNACNGWNLAQQIEEARNRERDNAYRNGLIELGRETVHHIGNAMVGVTSHASAMVGLRKDIQLLGQALHKANQELEEGDQERAKTILKTLEQACSNEIETRLWSHLQPLLQATENIEELIENQRQQAKSGMFSSEFYPLAMVQELERQINARCEAHGIRFLLAVEQEVGEVMLPYNPLLNLLLTLTENSCDAIQQAVEEGHVEAGEGVITLKLDAMDEEWQLRLEDNGIGIAADQLSKVQQVGYTTKAGRTARDCTVRVICSIHWGLPCTFRVRGVVEGVRW